MPESQREVQALLALSQAERLGRVRRLLAHFGSAQEALAAADWTAAVGAPRTRAAARRKPTSLGLPRSGKGSARPAAACLAPGDAHYPQLLSQIAAPPPVLFALGPDDLAPPTVAIVGSRKASDSGKLIAGRAGPRPSGARRLHCQRLSFRHRRGRPRGRARGRRAHHRRAGLRGRRALSPSPHPALPPDPRARRPRLRVCLGGAARAGGLPAPQPHHQRAELGGGHRRGPAKERRTDYSATRTRSKPRGSSPCPETCARAATRVATSSSKTGRNWWRMWRTC